MLDSLEKMKPNAMARLSELEPAFKAAKGELENHPRSKRSTTRRLRVLPIWANL